VQPTRSSTNVLVPQRATSSTLLLQGRQGQGTDPARFLTRGPLAARAHRLLGLGPVGAARLGQSQRALTATFGGDPQTWHHVGTPWIAARSLARPVDALPTQSSAAWLLGSRR
jgi:hypothetical protein